MSNVVAMVKMKVRIYSYHETKKLYIFGGDNTYNTHISLKNSNGTKNEYKTHIG